MPRPEKVQAVEKIRSQLDEARATFVTEYRGLTVGEQQELRRGVQKAQGEYQVLKMSLARLATEGMDVEGLNELLVGPTALAFANTDPVPVAKVLRDFANDHEKLIIKGGILGGTMLPPEQITRLADIEPRDVLLSKVAGGFKAPMAKFAGLLGAKMRDAASMFSQLLEKKEADAPVVEEAPVAVPEPATEEAPEEAPAAVVEEAAEVVAEEAPAAVVEEAAEVVAEEAPAAVVEEAAEVVAEEAPAAVVEEAAEVVAEEAPAAVVEEAAEVVAEEAPAAVVEEAAEVVAEEAPAAVVEEAAEVVAEEAPAADASPDIETTDQPAPKKKAAPKAKAKKSPAKADADAAAADGSDDTAEEE